MKMLAASKKKCPNCRAGTTRRRIKRLYAPQFVHHSEIIVLLRSVAVQAAKQIYDIITQTKDKQALHLEHTNRLSKGPGGLQIKKKESIKRVHGNRAVETDLQLFSGFPTLLLQKID